MYTLVPRHTSNAAKQTSLEQHIPALQHVVGSQRCCQHYDTLVRSVTRFKVLVMNFSEVLSTKDKVASHRAFVTATLDEGSGLSAPSQTPLSD